MFTGSIVALITPMKQNGSIDKISLKNIVKYHISCQTTAIVVLGTTGEAPTITYKEAEKFLRWSIEFSDGRIPIIMGIISNSTHEAVRWIKKLNHFKISGYLSVTPYYNCPTQEGLYQHFKIISENSNLPFILYNTPSRSGCDLLPSTISQLSKIENIIGIKEASGDLNRVNQIQKLVNNDKFLLLSGNDSNTLNFIRLGGHGVISVTANIAAKEMAQLCKLALERKYSHAEKLNNILIPVYQSLFIETNPIPIKWASKKLGLITSDTIRLPMTKLKNSNKYIIKKSLENAGLLCSSKNN